MEPFWVYEFSKSKLRGEEERSPPRRDPSTKFPRKIDSFSFATKKKKRRFYRRDYRERLKYDFFWVSSHSRRSNNINRVNIFFLNSFEYLFVKSTNQFLNYFLIN